MADRAPEGNFKAKYLLDMFRVHTPCVLFLSLLHLVYCEQRH